MNLHHGRDLARPRDPVMPVVLRGGAWKARLIRNNCLRQHCHALATTFRRADMAPLRPVCARLLIVLEMRSRILTDIHPKELAVIAAVVRLGAYEDQWLRQPEDWQPDPAADARAQWASLLRHLLARYPVPALLDSAWEQKGRLIHFERDCWCALAYGRSLREVPGLPKSVSSRVLHAALTRGEGTTLVQAIWLAQLRQLGASPALLRTVFGSRATLDLSDHALWTRLTEKFATAADTMAVHFPLVADALAAVRAHRGDSQMEALLRLPLAALIRHSVRFVTQLLNTQGHLLTEAEVRAAAARSDLARLASTRWLPLLGSESFASKCGQAHGHAAWRVEELCSLDALREEGRAMSHCVAGYAHRCRAGTSAIFSIRHCKRDREDHTEVTSCATIEVQPRTRKIVQIRAYKNRLVNATILTLIREWAEANGLALRD